MVHVRRLIAILIGFAGLCMASTTVAQATMLHDPVPAAPAVLISPGSSATRLWQFLAFVALGVLLAVAIVGMAYSLSRSRRPEPSPRSHAPLRS